MSDLTDRAAGLISAHNEQQFPLCPGSCGCRLGTDDADRFECGCDDGCCDDAPADSRAS